MRKQILARTILCAAAVVLGVALFVPQPYAETSARDAAALGKSSLIYVATVRNDGNQSKAAPVWFITSRDNQVLIETSPTSWKAKRIKRGSPAIVWIGRSDGPAFIGKAEIVSDKALQDLVIDEYPRKYLLARVGFARPTREKIDNGRICVIRITPVRDLPEGFKSEPGTPAPKIDAAP
jgi:hypothetical protein